MKSLVLIASAVLLAGALLVPAIRSTASHRTVYEMDTRLWFLQLKLRGDVPGVSWAETLRRVGPEWPRRDRFDVAREMARGAAPCPVLWETPLGQFWGGERDGRELDLLTLEQAAGSIYERGDVSIRKGDIAIDVGAHLGTFTRIALQHGARQVIAVEPDPVNAACFERTFAPEIAAGHVRLVQAAAWHSPGSLQFEVGSASQTGHIAGAPTARAVTVRAVTLDDMAAELKLARVDFIKMDIEGAERYALAGARTLLAAHKPRLAICIYHASDDPQVVPQVVLAANNSYDVFTRQRFQAYFH
ncbi:MAG TPA: FkbM family methyltransferase [Vicinamibacterales bacterium]|nr:FkbM family methyltransferase [Vicinamibacterales bacterium]